MKRVHCIHYVISQNLAAEPVDNSNHKCPMTGNRRVSNVRAPDLIRALYLAFTQKIRKPMIENEKCIDNSLFIDEDGTPYLFFDRFNDGLNIWVAELEKDYMTIKENTMHPCIHVSQKWEEVWPRVNEGSFVVKHEDLYYMTYSANSYESQFYGIGCATATDIMGEWKKYDTNPLLQKPEGLVGVGHSAMFVDKEGSLRIVYHAHKDMQHIHPRAMYIGKVDFVDENGIAVMKISQDYIVPHLVK